MGEWGSFCLMPFAESMVIIMDKHKLAACGIDCNECGYYKITLYQDREAAELLVPWFQKMGWIGENDGAEAVLKKAPLCKGCWSDFVFCGKNSCYFNSCCAEKKINNCGECAEFPCKHHKKVMKDLILIHKKAIFNNRELIF